MLQGIVQVEVEALADCGPLRVGQCVLPGQGRYPCQGVFGRPVVAGEDVLGQGLRGAGLLSGSQLPTVVPSRARAVVGADQVDHRFGLVQRVFGRQGQQVGRNAGVQGGGVDPAVRHSRLDGLAHLAVEEVPLALRAPLDHVRPEYPPQGGEPEFVPRAGRELRHQQAQVRLAPAGAAEGCQVHERTGPGGAEQGPRAVQHPVIQRRNISRHAPGGVDKQRLQAPGGIGDRREVAFAAGEVVGVQQVQFLDGQLQPQRIARRRAVPRVAPLQQRVEDLPVQRAVVTKAYRPGDLAGLGGRQRFQRPGRRTGAGLERLRGPGGNRRGDESRVRRP